MAKKNKYGSVKPLVLKILGKFSKGLTVAQILTELEEEYEITIDLTVLRSILSHAVRDESLRIAGTKECPECGAASKRYALRKE